MNVFENIDEKINILLEDETQNVRKIVKDMRDDFISYFKDIQSILNEKNSRYMKNIESGLISQQEVISIMDLYYREFENIKQAYKLKRKNMFNEIKNNNDFTLSIKNEFHFDIIVKVKNITRKFQVRDEALEFRNVFQYEEKTFFKKKINDNLVKINFLNDKTNLDKISNIYLQVSNNDNLSSLYIKVLILEFAQIHTIKSFGKYGDFDLKFDNHDTEINHINNFDLMKLDTTETEDLFSILYDKKIKFKNNHMYLDLKQGLQDLNETINPEEETINKFKKVIKLFSK